MNKTKYDSKIMGITLFLIIIINFLATPYVFDGFLMKPIFDTITLILVIMLLFEINILGIKEFSMTHRILLITFSLLLIGSYILHQSKLEFFMICTWVVITSYLVIKEYIKILYPKGKEIPLNRLLYSLFFGLLQVILPGLSLVVLQSNQLILRGALVGLVIAVVITIYLSTRIKLKKNISIFLLILMFVPILTGLLSISFNYALDTSSAISSTYTITDLDIDTGARTLTTYDVYFIIEGKEYSIDVSKDYYYSLDIGDTIELNQYKGFFSYSYLIIE